MGDTEFLEDLSMFTTSDKSKNKTYWFYNLEIFDGKRNDNLSIGLFCKNKQLKILCTIRLKGERYVKIFDNLKQLKTFLNDFEQFDLDLQTLENIWRNYELGINI